MRIAKTSIHSASLMSIKKALITGITGQDGAYLAELLLAKGYEVHGVKRRSSQLNTERIDHLYQDRHQAEVNLYLHYGDLTDALNITRIIKEVRPDEIYNLGAMSHVKVSFDTPEYTADVDGLGILRILEAIRLLGLTKTTKVYQASSSEMFGLTSESPQNENTPFRPRSPYGAAKLYAHWITVNYREAYGIFACSGILFNHESPLRGETFVTRKITRAVARIAMGQESKLYLGNLDAKRDWGHAKDYVEAMWLMLQQPVAKDYVIATGVALSVRELAQRAFAMAGIDTIFIGKGEQEKGVVSQVASHIQGIQMGDVVIEVDPMYYRPNEVDSLLGDSSHAHAELGWQPRHTVDDLISEMVTSDIAALKAINSAEKHTSS